MHSLQPRPRKMTDPPHFSIPKDHVSFDKFKTYAASIPYSIEPNSQMQDLLDFIITRITQTILAKDYEPGLLQWDSMLAYWLMLKYPLPKAKRIALAKVYFNLCVIPGMPLSVVSTCAETLQVLTRSKRKLRVEDLRFDWRPIWEVLEKDLFLSRRQFEITQTSYYMGHLAEITRRFFHPACADDMLEEFVPRINGMDLNSVLSTQYFMNTFLPLSHPFWMPMVMKLWQSVNSYMFDERHLALLSTLAEMHVDPTISDPDRIDGIPFDGAGEKPRVRWNKKDYYDDCYRDPVTGRWKGLYQDVGIFTQEEWDFIMCKCLASMQIPLADGGSLTTGPSVDEQASFEFSRLPKSQWRIFSLARLIVYSMFPDGKQSSQSGSATPFEMPLPPTMMNGAAGGGADYFSIPLPKERSYLAGCKALDSLARLIVSVENFFHPSNSGAWTADLSAFVKYIVLEFNKRWHEEEKEDCNVPMNRRLTPEIRRELVRCLRTVALLAMFSRDGATVSNIQSAMKSITVMEPELILHPVLERAIPSLEALVETQRTTAVIKALGAVALALVSRDVYYAGSKHLLNILELLLPGIDLNDPTKTMCTTAFLVEVSQYVKFGDLTQVEAAAVSEDNVKASWSPDIRKKGIIDLPQVRFDLLPEPTEEHANANPAKTLARFVPFCIKNIRHEIEHGASSLRTTSMTRMLPSDATLHWNLAILRGSICNDGRAILPYREELTSLLKLLHEKTFSKRGFSWTGNLICSIVLTLTHTYPLENKFVNPDEWESEDFQRNHHKYWGKLYSAKDVKIQWHTASEEELDFAFDIFENLVDPTITLLQSLLDESVPRDAVWRNDFCR
ncbi:hypothetical protein FRC02_008250 [Tulasnella sp. 418]|nr:hypothetical protein FRC02_008250 [Tulasnella sp. 418]